MCPRGSDPFYAVTYYIKWVATSWTHSSSKWLHTSKISQILFSEFNHDKTTLGQVIMAKKLVNLRAVFYIYTPYIYYNKNYKWSYLARLKPGTSYCLLCSLMIEIITDKIIVSNLKCNSWLFIICRYMWQNIRPDIEYLLRYWISVYFIYGVRPLIKSGIRYCRISGQMDI